MHDSAALPAAGNGRRRISRRTVITVTVAVVGIAGGAIAYFSAGGSGSGTASTGTPVAITINQTSTVTNLLPGSAAQALSGNFTNTNAEPVYVAFVTATIASVEVGGVDVVDACTDDYVIAGTGAVGASVPVGTNVGSWGNLTIQLVDSGDNQDACQGAEVTISYTAT